MYGKKWEDTLIGALDQHFKKAARDYVVKESTDTPTLQIVIEMTLYNYYVIRLFVDKSTVFCSIIQSGFQFPLIKSPLQESELQVMAQRLEHEVKLRIPDKYLAEKGW